MGIREYYQSKLKKSFLLTVSIFVICSLFVFNSQAIAQTPPLSDPPTGLTATAISPSDINLAWTAPSNNGGSTITGYKIEYKIGKGSYSLVTHTANTLTYFSTGLIPSTSYTYRVSTDNAAGTSTPSNEASATTQPLVATVSSPPIPPQIPPPQPLQPIPSPSPQPSSSDQSTTPQTPSPHPSPSSHISFTVSTDKSSYSSGDTVTSTVLFSGTNEEQNIAVDIKDQTGSIIISKTVTTDSRGAASLQFNLPTSAQSGSYQVVATSSYNGNDWENSASFDLQQNGSPLSIGSAHATEQQGNSPSPSTGLGFLDGIMKFFNGLFHW